MATKPTGAVKSALEKKAKAEANKSSGMRMLFEAGYSVSEIREVITAPYGFVYGVGVRGGFIASTPRAAKAKPAAKATKAAAKAAPRAKAAAKPAAKKTAAKAKA